MIFEGEGVTHYPDRIVLTEKHEMHGRTSYSSYTIFPQDTVESNRYIGGADLCLPLAYLIENLCHPEPDELYWPTWDAGHKCRWDRDAIATIVLGLGGDSQTETSLHQCSDIPHWTVPKKHSEP